MRYGVCIGLENAPIVDAAGYDYIELGFSSALKPELPEAEVLPPILDALEKVSIRAEAFNGMVPGEIRVTGNDVDWERIVRFLAAGYGRVASLGGEVVVFGSGAARNVPEGFPRERAYEQLREFLVRAGDLAADAGVRIAVEPLNRDECNILNSVAEVTELVERVAHPSVQILSDLYHVGHDAQSFSETTAAGERLRHVHVASCPSRCNPGQGDIEYLAEYFRALRGAGYDSRVSVEASWTSLADQAASTLAAMKSAWELSRGDAV